MGDSHVAMVFGSPFTATRRRVLPYDTHAAFNSSILFSPGVCRLPSLVVAPLFLCVFVKRLEELGVSDRSSRYSSRSRCPFFTLSGSWDRSLECSCASLLETGGFVMGRHIGQDGLLAPETRPCVALCVAKSATGTPPPPN